MPPKNPPPSPAALAEDFAQYASGPLTPTELSLKFPHRPINHSPTPPFSSLYLTLFNPLIECKPTTTSSASLHPQIGRAHV